MNLNLTTIILLAAAQTTLSCSEVKLSPADKNRAEKVTPADLNPGPTVAPAPEIISPIGPAVDTTTTASAVPANRIVPVFTPDPVVMYNDLIDPSVAVYLAPPNPSNVNVELAVSVRRELARRGVTPLVEDDFRHHAAAKIELGKMLFNDRILSGNMTVSCASCHVIWRGSGDGLSLMNDIGTRGLFAHIVQPELKNLLPRNTPPLFNRGHRSFTKMFWDGRVEYSRRMPSGIKSPANDQLPEGLDSVVAAQALFPLISPEEMLGNPWDNEIASRSGQAREIWDALMFRIKGNAQYMELLRAAYPDVPDQYFDIQHVANALAAYQDHSFRADDSAFDRFLKGDNTAMTKTALLGAQLFYGKAKCSSCHSGPLQTDHEFHAIDVPQFGPGKGNGYNHQEDFGRGGVTNKSRDRYQFRTPSLRNVYLTGPWGHNGAFSNLEVYIRHYIEPEQSLASWNPQQLLLRVKRLPPGFFDPYNDCCSRQNILEANEFRGVRLTDEDVAWLVEFLGTLTDRSYLYRSPTLAPTAVPSGMNDFLGVFGLKMEWFETLKSLDWL